ncbi:conserved hypothetical protein [Perkinsus marinus ATCC 50983]|uniref:CCAAT-binding factor domain-containing protein n=1 Tax=Perkinsus marinus (strain ATCC 50983 / TXsc) TaxID=423536 RepID=C5KLU5_PERM5|nr:conserved hypothetical protein [Perkinsus marinus ATCC 50983]EER14544.1 conserved hypothetical protein [Perkinsus marinus ATCC 50983]|eukprot:XP_002782749.1 conserved hypothetical protein [Perkinsus marinus ATCC 50983]
MVGGKRQSSSKGKSKGPEKPSFKTAKLNAKGGKGRWNNPAIRAAKRRQHEQQLANLPPEEAKARRTSMTVEPGMSAVAEHALDLGLTRSEELQKLIDWQAVEGKKKYDAVERDPRHSAALDGSKCCWELLPMKHHYCPGVADKTGIMKTARETIEVNSFPKALAGLCMNVEEQEEEEGGQVALPCVLRYYNDPVVVAMRDERKRASEKNREDYVGVEDENEGEEEEEFFEAAANEEMGDDMPEDEEESEDEALAAALAEEEDESEEEDMGDFDEDDEAAFAAMDGIGADEEEAEKEEEEKVVDSPSFKKSKNPRKRLRELMAGGTFVSADEVADLIAADSKKSRHRR